MTFEEWMATVPERVKAEACWRFDAYPRALYLYELAWDGCEALVRDERGEQWHGNLSVASGLSARTLKKDMAVASEARIISTSCALPRALPGRQRGGTFVPAGCWGQPLSRHVRLFWMKSLHSWSPRNVVTVLAIADPTFCILHPTFCILHPTFCILRGRFLCPSSQASL